jgi:hypothetical protein
VCVEREREREHVCIYWSVWNSYSMDITHVPILEITFRGETNSKPL